MGMFWDKVASLYDGTETLINGKVFNSMGRVVATEIEPDDLVLECACGTGAISREIAPYCRKLIATDMSGGMRKQARKKCREFDNVKIGCADIMNLRFKDETFDKVVAGNVIHLLDDPQYAVKEMVRVCKKGGKVIIPTYINDKNETLRTSAKFLAMIGVEFKSTFNIDSYKQFFADAGYSSVSYHVVEGRMPCAVAVITKQ
ncbi:MAG: methyltransferase domain-containing protein [Ruminococcus sp.]|nr:methyltransferase domain-containing protein [Ruminococcus sp.]